MNATLPARITFFSIVFFAVAVLIFACYILAVVVQSNGYMATPLAAAASASIGSTRADWEQQHGQAEPSGAGVWYNNRTYYVVYAGDKIYQLSRFYGDTSTTTIPDAQGDAKKFLPPDATLIKSFTAAGGVPVDVYHSQWLITQYPATMWSSGTPGDFIIAYRSPAGVTTVASFIIQPGDTP